MPGLSLLESAASQEVFAFFLIFARLGAMMMLFPGIGEGYVPARVRLAFALAVALALTPVVSPGLPSMPESAAGLFLLMGFEIAVGLLLGTMTRLLLSALNVAGNIIALQSGLGFALNVDPTQGTQGAILSTFLVTLGITLVFVTGAYQLMFGALVKSYDLFAPGAALPVSGFVELTLRIVAGSFALGVELSAPFLVFSLVFYAGLGVVTKLMPQFQIFFVSLPLSILGAFGLLLMLAGLMMEIFLDRFAQALRPLLN